MPPEFSFRLNVDMFNDEQIEVCWFLEFGDDIGSALLRLEIPAPTYISKIFPYGNPQITGEKFYELEKLFFQELKIFNAKLGNLLLSNLAFLMFLSNLLLSETMKKKDSFVKLPRFFEQAFKEAFLLAISLEDLNN